MEECIKGLNYNYSDYTDDNLNFDNIINNNINNNNNDYNNGSYENNNNINILKLKQSQNIKNSKIDINNNNNNYIKKDLNYIKNMNTNHIHNINVENLNSMNKINNITNGDNKENINIINNNNITNNTDLENKYNKYLNKKNSIFIDYIDKNNLLLNDENKEVKENEGNKENINININYINKKNSSELENQKQKQKSNLINPIMFDYNKKNKNSQTKLGFFLNKIHKDEYEKGNSKFLQEYDIHFMKQSKKRIGYDLNYLDNIKMNNNIINKDTNGNKLVKFLSNNNNIF